MICSQVRFGRKYSKGIKMSEIVCDDTPEGNLVERPAIEQLVKLGYKYRNGYDLHPLVSNERTTSKDVILEYTFLASLKKINPTISDENLKKVARELTVLQQSNLIEANQFIHKMLIQYASVEQQGEKRRQHETVKIIDFDNVSNNEFYVVNQTKYLGHKEPNIIPDIVLYVNGLPLAVIECKQPYIPNPMESAIDQLRRYANTRRSEDMEGCERLFYYNQIMVSTCRDKALAGTISSQAGHYLSWHKFNKNDSRNSQEILIDTLFNCLEVGGIFYIRLNRNTHFDNIDLMKSNCIAENVYQGIKDEKDIRYLTDAENFLKQMKKYPELKKYRIIDQKSITVVLIK